MNLETLARAATRIRMATTEVVDWGQSISQWGGGVDPVYDTEYDTELSLSFSLVVNLCVSEVIHLRYFTLIGSETMDSLESVSALSLVLTFAWKRDHSLENDNQDFKKLH